MVFDVKGASGTLPCPLCTNLVSRLHEHDPTGRLLLPLHTTDYTLLRCVSDESAWQTQALLISREPTMTKKDFAQLQQSVGMNWNLHGVLAHRSLGLRSSLMFDFMHIYLVNGLFHQEVGRLLPKLYEAGHSFESILSFMESFSWPHNLQSRKERDFAMLSNCPRRVQGIGISEPELLSFASALRFGFGCDGHGFELGCEILPETVQSP